MLLRRLSFAIIVALCLGVISTPCFAWLYDAGIAQHLGLSIKADSNCEWVAAPFTVDYDCYATTLGAAVARAMGPVDAGLDVYLTTTWYGLPGSAIAKLSQPLVPLNTQYVYYYGTLSAPVFLKAGTVYSLVLMPTSPLMTASISYGAKPGTYYGWKTADYGESWNRLTYPVCVRVDGYAVPEPGTLCALASGLTFVYARRKRYSTPILNS
ncbi:MAG: choice-of-anchor R domain-containing protein [Armatimonadota bacterium]